MTSRARTVVLVIALAASLQAAAAAEEAWSIGVRDGDYREFAVSGNYPAYASAFPRGVAVDADQPEVSKRWPYIHPGPADAWAGSRSHRFTIAFRLTHVPPGSCRINIGLVNTHYASPPALGININGRTVYRHALPTGGLDLSLTDPKAGRPQEISVPFTAGLLRVGSNAIHLEVVSGSWLLYDYVALQVGLSEPPHPVVRSLSASGTMLFRKTGNGLRQVVHVSVQNDGMEGTAAVVLHGDAKARKTVRLVPGPNLVGIDILPVRHPGQADVVVTAGTSSARTTVRLKPERRWTVYAVPSSHTDIGYTDIQENAVERHLMNTVRALEARRTYPGFRWNLEVAFHADLISMWRPDLRNDLVRAVRTGDIGIQGLYLNMLTGLCSSEEMVRVLARGAEWRNVRSDIARTASLNDVPSTVGTMPTILRHSGYRYFTDAVNEYRGPVFRHADQRMRQCPFWWQGPDGSRVLAVFTHGYAQMGGIGLTSSVDEVERSLPGWLRGFDRPDYPGSAAIAYGGFSDNIALSPVYAQVVREWNRRYAYPRVILGTASDFFRHVERESGAKLPVFTGDMGSYWEDGAASSAHETAITRHARSRLSAAQRILTLRNAGVPATSARLARELDDAWRSVIFYNEHTWGAWCSISAPYAEQTLSQWRRKKAFADEARERSKAIVNGLGAPAVARVGAVVRVWNANAWVRSIEVTLPAAADSGALGVQDIASARMVASQMERHGGKRLVFTAHGVPPFGYRDFRVTASAWSGPAILCQSSSANEWQSATWRMRLDPATGSVSSLTDVASGREWLRSNQGHSLNQFLYVAGGEGSGLINQSGGTPTIEVRSHRRADVTLVENGAVRAVLHLRRTGVGLPDVDTYLLAHADGRLEFRNIVHHRSTTAKEAAYFAFPFALNAEKVRNFVDVPMGVVEAERGQLAGACREWYACSTFASASDDERTALVLMPHSPLATVGDIFRGQWRKTIEPSSAIYAYVLNNYWDTNYRANQDGPLVFAFSVRTSDRPFDPEFAWRAGCEETLDMADPNAPGIGGDILSNGALVTEASPNVVPASGMGGSEAHASRQTPAFTASASTPQGSGLNVTGAEVVSVLPRGDEIVIQLLNLRPEAVTATISVPGMRIRKATLANLVGERPQPVRIRRDGAVAVTIGPNAPASVSLRLAHMAR